MIFWISAIGVALSLIYYAAATLAVIRFSQRTETDPPPLPKIAPRVVILKPLHGLSETLSDNVISYLELDYPRKEFVFGVADYTDGAATVPLGLKARYQFADIALSVGETANAANRKVAKLIKMSERLGRAETVVLSDADIEVDRDHLRRVIGELAAHEKTGVVTCIYRAKPMGGIGARFEAMFVNTDFLPMALLSESIEPMRHAFGATIAIKRNVLEAIGGFESLKDLLADDFFLGRLAAEKGFGVKLSSSVVTINSEEKTFGDFWAHQLRWARTYRTVRPVSVTTIVTHGPFWALLVLISSGFALTGFGTVAIVLAARWAMSAVVMNKIVKLPAPRKDLWLVPVKDLMMTAVWAMSLVGNQVVWGGRRFRLLGAGKMEEIGTN